MKISSKIFLLVLMLVACKDNKNQEPGAPVTQQTQTEIEKIELTGLNGDAIEMKKYKGKTVFINFWATWCKPCLEEMPSIQKTMELVKDRNIEFLFASDESQDEIEQFKKAHDFNFNYVKARSLSEMSIMGLPTTLIFNPDGKLVFSDVGYRRWDDKTNIDLLLNNSKPK